jgi:hypothetical protein
MVTTAARIWLLDLKSWIYSSHTIIRDIVLISIDLNSVSYNEDDPFSHWSDLIHKSVYSIDGKKLGFLRKVLYGYMFISRGFINLTKYFVPITLAESVSKKGIRLKITAYEARSKYSYSKMKNTLTSLELMPKSTIQHRPLYDRFLTLRYSVTRNRLAAAAAFVSGILFLLSGYKANLEIYDLIRMQIITIESVREFWGLLLAPIGLLAILAQLGGIAVLMGAALFIANRVNMGKFLVLIGTGQGLFTIALRIMTEMSSGRLLSIEHNYITWLTTSAAGSGILFAIISQSISKGKNESFMSKALRFARSMIMGKIMEKVKGTVTGAKDKVKGVGEATKNKVASSTSSADGGVYEQGAAGTETSIKDDPLTSYREKEAMTPAKIKEYEPTAVKRKMTEKIVEPGQAGTNPEEAAEIARKKG